MPSSSQQKHLAGNDSILPDQDEILTSQEKPFKWGLSFYLQPHYLEILALFNCMVAKTCFMPPASFSYNVHKLHVSNWVSSNSVMITSLGLGRTHLALPQYDPTYNCS